MKIFAVMMISLLTTLSTQANDCDRLEQRLRELQERVDQCRETSSDAVCSITKNGHWRLLVSGNELEGSYDFDALARKAMEKESSGYCRYEKPSCSITKNGHWRLMINGSELEGSYDFEAISRKAQEKDGSGFCRFSRPTCSITKNGHWRLLIDGAELEGSYDFDALAAKKNRLASDGLCN